MEWSGDRQAAGGSRRAGPLGATAVALVLAAGALGACQTNSGALKGAGVGAAGGAAVGAVTGESVLGGAAIGAAAGAVTGAVIDNIDDDDNPNTPR